MPETKIAKQNSTPRQAQGRSKAWVVAVDMGYGHQRAAYPLRHLAYGGKIIQANSYPGINKKDKKIWDKSRHGYELISRFKNVPLIGEAVFDLFDKFQKVPQFYPRRDLTEPSLQLKSTISLIKRKKWGKALIDKLNKKPLPLIATFFIPAYMAEEFGYRGDIYSVICDADVSRAWVAPDPFRSKIKYLVPTYRVAERLKLYGVKEENIYLTGFPLPLELIGNNKLDVLKKDLSHRLYNLDPLKRYHAKYEETVENELGRQHFHNTGNHKLTITFAVGGAGAQKELGLEILKSLKQNIKERQIVVNLIAGIHNDVSRYFKKGAEKLGLGSQLGKGVKIMFAQSKQEYFRKFNQLFKTTDILWTKPSELCFYSALGVPIIMSEPIGSQEFFNRKWLRTIGAGINQEDVRYTNEWLFDWVQSGWFAEAAMQGYFEAAKYGTYNIEKVIEGKVKEAKVMKTVLQY